MSRTVATLPAGSRITDYISLGVVAKTFPLDKVHAALAATERESARQRDLPGHVTVYYVIALALYMQSSYREVLRCLLEGIQWLARPSARIVTGAVREAPAALLRMAARSVSGPELISSRPLTR